jgi:hypothetical protein
VVHRNGERIYTAGLRVTSTSRLRIVDGVPVTSPPSLGPPDRHGFSAEHLLVWPAGEPGDEVPSVLSAHLALDVGDARLDVLSGDLRRTPHAWRSRPLRAEEARPGLRVARVEEWPLRGAPDSPLRALRASWTVGSIEAVAGAQARLHGRWTPLAELRLVEAP